jgi:hypothetical protein
MKNKDNPFTVKGESPKEVLRFGEYKCYEEEIEKLTRRL